MATTERVRRAAPAIPSTRLPSAGRDRRPALAALAVLLILGGALASGLLVYRSGDRIEVLVAARELAPGERVEASDLTVARVAGEGLDPVPASSERNFVGTYVVSRVPEGALISRQMFVKQEFGVPEGAEEVGVGLDEGRLPAAGLRTGDVIRIYQVAGGEGVIAVAEVLAQAARVTRVEGGGSGVLVSVIVPTRIAPALVQAAATGQVSVSLLPSGTAPQIDNGTG